MKILFFFLVSLPICSWQINASKVELNDYICEYRCRATANVNFLLIWPKSESTTLQTGLKGYPELHCSGNELNWRRTKALRKLNQNLRRREVVNASERLQVEMSTSMCLNNFF
jgi:hypothetical protein